VVLGLFACGLTANVVVGVTARAAAGVSVRAAARAAARADAKVAARNKPMRLIGSRLLSQLLVA
jgi:hypothetical protein